MSRAISLVLGEYFDQLIEAQVKSGRYETASEVVRDALRLFEQKQTAIQRVSDAVDQGFASGFVDELDWNNLAQRPETEKRDIGN
jgi:antitoxin ParD1/3/4